MKYEKKIKNSRDLNILQHYLHQKNLLPRQCCYFSSHDDRYCNAHSLKKKVFCCTLGLTLHYWARKK